MKKLLTLAGLLAVLTLPVHAAVLLTVDVTNPLAVTFTATSNFSLTNNSSFTENDGTDLIAFFTSTSTSSGATTGTLRPAGTTNNFNTMSPDNYSGSIIDLNLFTIPGTEFQAYTTSTTAFTGVATINLGGDFLPSPGASGDIRAGFYGSGSGSLSGILGTWTVVPEPSTFAPVIALAALAGAMWSRQRRKVALPVVVPA